MDNESWIELAVAACAHAGIKHGTIETIATWNQKYCTNAVYCISGQQYLKIFGPTAQRQFHIERSALRTLENHKAIAAPRIVAEGGRTQSPPYLIITGIAGSTAEDIWDDLSRSEQLAIAREIGTITANIHRLPQEDLAAVEERFGGRREHIESMQTRQTEAIKAMEKFSLRQRDDLMSFMQGEARELVNGLPKFIHAELAHNHIYLARENGTMKVTGFIDWADAMLGLPEWDIAYLWFWTFSCDSEAMRECLQMVYADSPPPERLARRCLAATLHTYSMSLQWPYLVERGIRTQSVAREMTEFYFPADVFGPPD